MKNRLLFLGAVFLFFGVLGCNTLLVSSTPISGTNGNSNGQYWKDIPIMPGATGFSSTDKGCTYSIRETPETVEKYYVQTMNELGWNLTVDQEVSNSFELGFQKGNITLGIFIVLVPRGSSVSISKV